MGEYLKIKEAAEYLGIHPQTLRNWYKKGLLKIHRANPKGKVLIKKSELDKAMQNDGINTINN